MSNALRIAVSEEKGNVPITVLLLSGDLDSKSFSELESKSTELIANGTKNFILDLGGVNYMGSAGLRALHSISNKLKTAGEGGKLKLVNPSEPVHKVMKTLGFEQFFDIHPSVDEAVQSF